MIAFKKFHAVDSFSHHAASKADFFFLKLGAGVKSPSTLTNRITPGLEICPACPLQMKVI